MKKTWNVLFLLAAWILLPTGTLADFVGINIGASEWSNNLPGAKVNQSSAINSTDDFNDDEISDSSLILILKNPNSILPNFKYQGFNLDSSDSSTVGSSLTMNGQSFTLGNQVPSSYDLSHDDIVFYYDLSDNWVDLDMGIDLKRFDGEVALTGSDNSIQLDETIPLLYFSARFDLPYNGFYIGADFNNLSIGDSIVEDSTIKLGYESDNGLGFEGGLKSFSLELDDSENTQNDLEYDGIFLNGYIQF